MRLRELIRRIAIQRKEEFPFPDDLDAYLEDFVPNTLLKSETLQIAFGVTGVEIEGLYQEAYNYYEADQYQDASTVFRWLVILNPFVTKYWMGLAATQQLLKQYEKALHSYAVASLLESEDPYPHFHAYECYCALEEKEEAEKALELAYQRTEGKAAYEELRTAIGGVLCHSTSK